MTGGVAQLLADHWYLLVAGWWVWKFLDDEKKARREADRLRRDDERKARDEQREVTREVVREALSEHVKEESLEFGRFREDLRRELAGVGDLVRQHDQRIRDLENRE